MGGGGDGYFLELHDEGKVRPRQGHHKGRTIRNVMGGGGGGEMGKKTKKKHARENAKKKNSCKEEEGKEKKFMQKEGPIVIFI